MVVPAGAVEAGAEALGCCTVGDQGNKDSYRKKSHLRLLFLWSGQRRSVATVARNRELVLYVRVLMSAEPPPSETPLNGRKILIVEDEAPIALNLAAAVQQAGGIVIGPVASVAGAHAAMADNRLDGALLDIRLRNETSFPLADVLAVLNIPFVFVSGLSSALMPYTHRERPLFDKPYDPGEVIATLARLVKDAGTAEPRANDAPA